MGFVRHTLYDDLDLPIAHDDDEVPLRRKAGGNGVAELKFLPASSELLQLSGSNQLQKF